MTPSRACDNVLGIAFDVASLTLDPEVIQIGQDTVNVVMNVGGGGLYELLTHSSSYQPILILLPAHWSTFPSIHLFLPSYQKIQENIES